MLSYLFPHSYCKLITETTCKDSFETLQFCEAQAKKDKALLYVYITHILLCILG